MIDMKRVLEILAMLMIWACILVLCGEKTDAVSSLGFYMSKGAAIIVLAVSARWLDSKLSKETN